MERQAQEACRQHSWQRTQTPGIFVCSTCQATGRRREQIAQDMIWEMEFPEEQALQRQRSPQPQNMPSRIVSHPEEIDLDTQSRQVTEELKQGKQDTEELPKRKSKWPTTPAKWIKLLATPLTLLLAIGGLLWSVYQFNAQQSASAAQTLEQQSASAAQTLEQQRQITFNTYLDRMSDLLLIDNLQTAKPDSAVRAIAEARTFTALRDLDGSRRAELVRFLWKAKLVTGNQPVISLSAALLTASIFQHALLNSINLSGALLFSSTFDDCNLQGAFFKMAVLPGATLKNVDLSGANMTQANLYGATLEDATLTGTNMTAASLQRANLSGDDLTQVNLTSANLAGANLKGARIMPTQLKQIASLQGTIMPNGSKHP